MQKNRIDSSENLVENVESITNITTDASNLERINRWNSVFAMVKEKPIFGFGPGTYMFEYAPYQKSRDLTIISTNFGDVGNAHSEYLGPLAETGYPGLLIVLFLLTTIFFTAYRCYKRLTDGMPRHFLLFATLALVTYFSHGFLNNFLDSDKASVPVFGAMAIIVAIDIVSRERSQKK
ncbi:MAG: O-antigen ligase family protein [Saprospiraceae bacterium]|nr:O-antigen ligase family protein [Saprospiraceae bacterium]